jgi:hypothetical protein
MIPPDAPAAERSTPIPALVLVTADWAGPAKPARTVLRELSRRWGDAVLAVLVENPEPENLEQLDVDVVPTWLLFEPAEERCTPDASVMIVEELRGSTLSEEALHLPGPWKLVHRRSGALPKHVVAEEFGPDRRGRSDS